MRVMVAREAQTATANDSGFAGRVQTVNAERVADGKPPLNDNQIVNMRAKEIVDNLYVKSPAFKAEISRRDNNRKARGQKPLKPRAVLKIAQDWAREGKLQLSA